MLGCSIEGLKGYLIDLDLIRPRKFGVYPLTFNVNIRDGKRSEGATPGASCYFFHDLEAFQFILTEMIQLKSPSSENNDRWKQILATFDTFVNQVKGFEEENVWAASPYDDASIVQIERNLLTLLDVYGGLSLELKSAAAQLNVEVWKGTGSPQKK